MGVLIGYTILFNVGIILAHQYLDRESTCPLTLLWLCWHLQICIPRCGGTCVADAVQFSAFLAPCCVSLQVKALTVLRSLAVLHWTQY